MRFFSRDASFVSASLFLSLSFNFAAMSALARVTAERRDTRPSAKRYLIPRAYIRGKIREEKSLSEMEIAQVEIEFSMRGGTLEHRCAVAAFRTEGSSSLEGGGTRLYKGVYRAITSQIERVRRRAGNRHSIRFALAMPRLPIIDFPRLRRKKSYTRKKTHTHATWGISRS